MGTSGAAGPSSRRAWHAWLSVLVLLLALLGAGLSLEQLSQEAPSSALPAMSSREGSSPTPPAARLFVVVLDSLRNETAMNAELMPNLARLRAVSSWSSEVTTVRDAVTAPALRAAFTGDERAPVFAFVRNFTHSDAGVESIFSQETARGRRPIAYSSLSFDQFGQADLDIASIEFDVPGSVPGYAGEKERQDEASRKALDDLRAGRHTFVVYHLTYADHTAHEAGDITSKLYRDAFSRADRMMGELADKALPEDTFVVMGDHGHDERGVHMIGREHPTFLLYRGPRFKKGLDIGPVYLTEHRFLMSWALGLPLPSDYRGGRHPAALLDDSGAPLPDVRAEPYVRPEKRGGLPPSHHGDVLWCAAHLGVLGGLWFAFLLAPPALLATAVGVVGALLSSTLLLFLARFSPFHSLAGVLLASVGLVVHHRAGAAAARRNEVRSMLWSLLPAVGSLAFGLAFYYWGELLIAHRERLFHPHASRIVAAWGFGLAMAIVLSRKTGVSQAAAVLVLVPLLLLTPTVYRHGSPAIMAPAWFAFTLLHRPPRSRSLVERKQEYLQWLSIGVVGALLFPFIVPDALQSVWTEWRFTYEFRVPGGFVTIGGVALTLLLQNQLGHQLRLPLRLLALACSGFLIALFANVIRLGRGEWMVVALLLGGAIYSRRAQARFACGRELARIAWLTAGLSSVHLLLRIPSDNLSWLFTLLCVLDLTASLAAARQGDKTAAYVGLMVLAALAVGWCTLDWTVQILEWHFLYDWFDAAIVEGKVGLFLPAIIFRFAIPLWIARFLLSERLQIPYPRLAMWAVVGARVFSLLLMTLGLATQSTGDMMLEAIQQTAIWITLFSGLA